MNWIKKIYSKINLNAKYQNKHWYVFLALFATILQIWTTFMVRETNSQVKNIQSYLSGAYNSQDTISSIWMTWEEFIREYYDALAWQDYPTACWFESNRRCEKSNTEQYKQYAKDKKRVWFAKLEDGEHLRDIWKPATQTENKSVETFCIRKEYIMKWENNPIIQIERMDILMRPNWEKEIASVICEKAIKNWEDRTKQMKCGQSNICNK